MSPISGAHDFRRFHNLCDDADISEYGSALISSLHSEADSICNHFVILFFF
jgi:hypothetical protein